MNFTTQMTERDKKLLVFLAAFLIIFGFLYFLIFPTIEKIIDINRTIEINQVDSDRLEVNISRIGESEDTLQEGVDDLSGETGWLFPMYDSKDIDSFLTNLALDNGFEKSDLRELVIAMPADELKLSAYGDTENEPDTYTGIYGAKASFTLYGDRDELERFLDTIAADYDPVRVAGYSWSPTDGKYLLTVDIVIYMTDYENIKREIDTLIETKTVQMR